MKNGLGINLIEMHIYTRSVSVVTRKSQGHSMSKVFKSGFTIVELLIVIVVIGILAAISIVSYTGIQNRANDTTIKNDLTNLAKVIQMASADTGSLPAGGGFRTVSGGANGGAGTNFPNITFSASKSSYKSGVNLVYCTAPVSAGVEGFVIWAKSTSGKTFLYDSTKGGTEEYSANPSFTIPTEVASCPSAWGYPRSWSYGWYGGNRSGWVN